MILIIDNYDSFTYNLVQLIGSIAFDTELKIFRNDALTLAKIERMAPERIIISPGPGRPRESGITLAVVERFGPRLPILGVCLGHQAIGEVYGASLVSSPRLLHGKTSLVYHHGTNTYSGVPSPFKAARYHSLILDSDSLPDCLELTAWTSTGEVMGVRHRKYPVEGVQFHPESVMTEAGKLILENVLGKTAPTNWPLSYGISSARRA